MFIPKHFQISDQQEAVDFINRYSFGTLVTTENALPIATHIPFTLRQDGEQLFLRSHIALANHQVNSLTAGKALAIFTEPHAYISPKHYEKELSVPTWNYLAVHAYGDITIVNSEEGKLQMLEEMIHVYEEDYYKQWQTLPLDWKLKLIKGIVAFEITVTDLQGKKKLSQNRTAAEKENIITAFRSGTDTNEKEIAEYMRRQE